MLLALVLAVILILSIAKGKGKDADTSQCATALKPFQPKMPPIMSTTPKIPTHEADFHLPANFHLESGGTLHHARLHYVVYGTLNPAKDNLILVPHALSGSAQVAEWWPAIWHMPGLIDSEHDAVLGINILGSCYGSTGPTSPNPATGQPYGPTFPLVTIRDTVRAQALLLDSLGVASIKLAIGASIGAMQTIEWSILFPDRVRKAIAIGVAPLGAMGLALNHLQRQTIMLDPYWRNGLYPPAAQPRRGLAIARALAVCSYKSDALFQSRFARNPDRSGEDPYADTSLNEPARFDVAGYLDHQGERFLERFDANTYLAITRLMDLFDPVRGHASPTAAYARIQAEIVLVGISSDWLFPPADIKAMADQMQAAGVRCTYRELISDHGHDAFLAEPKLLIDVLRYAGVPQFLSIASEVAKADHRVPAAKLWQEGDSEPLVSQLKNVQSVPFKNRKTRREQKFGKIMPVEPPRSSLSKRPQEIPGPRLWLRGIGAGAIFLGGFGIMQTLFLPSVIAVYVGIALILLDLVLERWERYDWSRYIIVAAILVITVVYSRDIVFRRDDLVTGVSTANGDFEVVLSNDTQEDYENLDIKIRPDPGKDYVLNARQVTHLPGLSFSDTLPVTLNGAKKETAIQILDGPRAGKTLTNFVRLHCDKLPSFTAVKIHIDLYRSDATNPLPVTDVSVEGSYKGKFRVFNINQPALLPAITVVGAAK